MADSDDNASPLIHAGRKLAENVIDSLHATPLKPRGRMLVWVGLLASLGVSCERQLGRETSEAVLQQAAATVRTERAKYQN